LSYPSLLAEM